MSAAGRNKFFQKYASHLKILGARKVTRGKFHIENSQLVGTILQNLVVMMTWCPVFVHPSTADT
jgi:hypothetical protein